MQQLIETLNKVFKHKSTGTYLDIGAYDGVTDNVTHWFYQHGWRGVCVEPQTKYFKLGLSERPEDRWVKGVVVGKEHEGKKVAFYEDLTGRYSSLYDQSGKKKKQLKAITVNDDVSRGCFEEGLDLLVVDTNSEEFDILESIDMGLWMPNIVAVPSQRLAHDKIIQHMQTMGYYHLAPKETGDWLVFSNDYEDSNAL